MTVAASTLHPDDAPRRPAGGWTSVCPLASIAPDTGVVALVAGVQVAVFRLAGGDLHAIDNHDPCSNANVLSRGIVGDLDGRPYIASPVHKQRFDLATGICLDADGIVVVVHDVRVIDGRVEVALRSA